MAAAANLDFQICEILLADGVWRAQTHNCTKFQSFRCGYIAIFRIFKMATAAILDFWNREILLVIRVQRVKMHLRAKFCQNWSIGYEDIKILSIFQDGGRPPYSIRLGHIWTTHSEYLWVSITLQNLVMIYAVLFIIWIFLYLTHLVGKCLFTPQNWVFFGNLIQSINQSINQSIFYFRQQGP